MPTSPDPSETRTLVCPNCDLILRGPVALTRRERTYCVRCGQLLQHGGALTLRTGRPLAIGALLFLSVASYAPLLSLSVQGASRDATVFTSIEALWHGGFPVLAPFVLACGLVFPLLRLLGYVYVLWPRRPGHAPRLLAPALRWTVQLRPWSMVDVYLCAAIVAYIKVSDLTLVGLDIALLGFAAAMVLGVVLDTRVRPAELLDALETRHERLPEPLEERPGTTGKERGLTACHVCDTLSPVAGGHQHCRRCGAALHVRKLHSLQRAAAFTLAAALLYVPANLLPFLTIERFGRRSSDTIMSGILEFAEERMWFVAGVIFVASIVVPLLKLLGLGYLLWAVSRRSRTRRRERSALFRTVEIIGRWSMIDVFIISILAALVDFAPIAAISVGPGAVAFAAMVVTSMIAAEVFDARLIWDHDGHRTRH